MSRPARPAPSPHEAALVRLMSRGRLSRRGLLGGAGALGVGAFLAACSGQSAATQVAATPGQDLSDNDKVVRWANWPLKLDKDDNSKKFPTLEEFRLKTGITPSYFEEIEDNDAYFASVQARLAARQDIGRDIVVFTDWMAARVVKGQLAQKLDKRLNIPNWGNILDKLKNVDYDPGRNYSLTWQSGITGIGWNVAKLKQATGKTELKTLDELWDPRLRGRVSVLSEMRDTVGLIMQTQGNDPSKPFTEDQFGAACDVLEKQISSSQVREVKGNAYKDDLVSGDVIAAMAWSGDMLQLNAAAKAANPGARGAQDDAFRFAIPESGGMIWNDNLLVPSGATHKANAEILMNWYYDPANAAKVAAYVNYISPVKNVQTEIAKLPYVDIGIAQSPWIFPDDNTLAKVKLFRSLTTKEEGSYADIFQRVLGN